MPAGAPPMLMALSAIESGPDGSFVIAGVPVTPMLPLQVMASDPPRGNSAVVAVPAGSADPPPVTLTLTGAPARP